ncbi:MAG: hypothetical protein H7332_01095 [Bdellovibrionales bacterium]|nr:hypothetical protein [Ramlibacter sp.]
MTSFVHPSFRTNHPGVDRVESALGAARSLRRGFDSTRSIAAMLLAAIVAAMLVVADQVVSTWADGHLLAGWIMLWAVAFAALAFFAGTARRLAVRTTASLDAWSRRVARARADERMWSIARSDPRVMADLQAALSRSEEHAVPAPVTGMVADPSEMPFVTGSSLQGRSFYGYY